MGFIHEREDSDLLGASEPHVSASTGCYFLRKSSKVFLRCPYPGIYTLYKPQGYMYYEFIWHSWLGEKAFILVGLTKHRLLKSESRGHRLEKSGRFVVWDGFDRKKFPTSIFGGGGGHMAEHMSSLWSWEQPQVTTSKYTGTSILKLRETKFYQQLQRAWQQIFPLFSLPVRMQEADNLISALWDPGQRTQLSHAQY